MAREYPAEVKAQVMAALLAGQSVSAAAKAYHIPKGTVSGWKQRETEPMIEGVAGVATQKGELEEVGNLLLRLVRAELKSLIAQAEHTGDKNWLNKQEASQLAMLHGVSHDKIFRLIEALDRAGTESNATAGE